MFSALRKRLFSQTDKRFIAPRNFSRKQYIIFSGGQTLHFTTYPLNFGHRQIYFMVACFKGSPLKRSCSSDSTACDFAANANDKAACVNTCCTVKELCVAGVMSHRVKPENSRAYSTYGFFNCVFCGVWCVVFGVWLAGDGWRVDSLCDDLLIRSIF